MSVVDSDRTATPNSDTAAAPTPPLPQPPQSATTTTSTEAKKMELQDDFFLVMADPAVILNDDNVMISANPAFSKHITSTYADRSFTKNLLHPNDIRTFTGLLTAFRRPPLEADNTNVSHDSGLQSSTPPPTTQEPIKCRIQTLSLTSAMPRYESYEWAISQNPTTRHLYMVGRNLTDPKRDISMAAEFEDFFNNAPIALHWLSSEGIVLWANQTELDFLGYTKEEYFSQSITKFCVDESHVVEIFKTLGSGNTIHDVPVRMRHKNGQIKHVLIDSNVNYYPDGTFNHTRCFIRDDTDRKVREGKMQLEIEHVQHVLKSKEDLFSSIAHDLRTPMQAMLGCVQLLLDTDLTEDQEDLGSTIFSSGAELCTMLDNIIDAMRSSSDSPLKINLQPMSLKVELEHVIKRMGVLLHDKDVLLSLAWHGNTTGRLPEWVMGDAVNFKRILINLIGNAIKFTDRGFITVSVKYDPSEPSGLCYRFAVTDTGRGIAKEEQPLVFQRYWQKPAEPGTGDKEVLGVLGIGGAGLGLSICAMAVEAMGGQIGVDSSQQVGRNGTTFWFKLPLEVIPDPSAAAKKRVGREQPGNSGPIMSRNELAHATSEPGDGRRISTTQSESQLSNPDLSLAASFSNQSLDFASPSSRFGSSSTIHSLGYIGTDRSGSALHRPSSNMTVVSENQPHPAPPTHSCASERVPEVRLPMDTIRPPPHVSANSYPPSTPVAVQHMQFDGVPPQPQLPISAAGLGCRLVSPPIVKYPGRKVQEFSTMQVTPVSEIENASSPPPPPPATYQRPPEHLFNGGYQERESYWIPMPMGQQQHSDYNQRTGYGQPQPQLQQQQQSEYSQHAGYGPPQQPQQQQQVEYNHHTGYGQPQQQQQQQPEYYQHGQPQQQQQPQKQQQQPQLQQRYQPASRLAYNNVQQQPQQQQQEQQQQQQQEQQHHHTSPPYLTRPTYPATTNTTSLQRPRAPTPHQHEPAYFHDTRSDTSSVMSSCSDFDPHNPLGLRILAAEDNMLCQKVLAQILKKLGCAVTIASDGMEAVRTWQENTEGFDAVLMDIRMPNMDGITATRLLREKGCAIPIIAVTAERGEAERQKCLLVGMNSFLSKPLLIKDLVTRLRDLC